MLNWRIKSTEVLRFCNASHNALKSVGRSFMLLLFPISMRDVLYAPSNTQVSTYMTFLSSSNNRVTSSGNDDNLILRKKYFDKC